MPILTIYRSGAEFTNVETGENETIFNGGVMSMNKITSQFEIDQPITFKIDDYVIHNAHTFLLSKLPYHKKTGKYNHEYNAVFLGREYKLYRKAFRPYGRATFPFTGTAADHLALIIGQSNLIDPGYTAGVVEETGLITILYSKDSCRTALTKLAEATKLEYEFKDQVINFKKEIGGFVHDLTFRQGMDNGLYEITRTSPDDSAWGTVFIGYGSTDNLPADYRDGIGELSFDPGFIERNLDKYPVIERYVEFPDIRPERTGTITATATINTVQDNTLDFDLNGVMVDGSAKIVFTTGDLQTQEFEITKYDHSTNTITFNVNKTDNYESPNDILKPAIGNKYKLIGIIMPASYVTNAENRVKDATIAHAEANKEPSFEFDLDIDPIFMTEMNYAYTINQGDKVHAIEEDMGADVILRVTEITYPIFNPFAIKATIATGVNYSIGPQLLKAVKNQEIQLDQIKRTSLQLQQINSIRRRELQNAMFDQEGFIHPDNIKAGSIEAWMLTIGTRPQDFALSVIFSPNLGANPNHISWTAGALTHFTIADTTKTWDLITGTRTDLVPTSLYYIYARCLKAGTAGTIVLDTVQRRVNDDPTYYYFLIGVAHTVITGVRPVSLTYGISEINGRFIKTGRITSNDGLTWFDLDTGEIVGTIRFRRPDGSTDNVVVIEEAAAEANVNAMLARNYIDNVLPGDLASLQSQIDGQIESFFYDYDPTLLNEPADDWNTPELKQQHANDTFTNTNTGGSWRWVEISGVWGWVVIADTATQQALALAGLAKDTADHKRRVFIATPTTPYDAGDMWAGGPSGEIMRCIVSRASGSYTSSDWDKASKYTDDTAVINLADALGTLAYDDVVEIAKLGETVIVGGYLLTELLDAEAIKADIVQTTDLNADRITSGTIDTERLDADSIIAEIVQVADLNANKITSGTIATARLDATTIKSTIVQTTNLSANQLTSGSIDANIIAVGNLNASNIISGTLATARLDADTIKSTIVQTTDLSAARITSGTIDTARLDADTIISDIIQVAEISASQLTAGTIDADEVNIINLNASNIETGTLDASIVSVINLNADNISSGSIDASVISVINIDADNITTGSIDAAEISVINIDAANITAGTISASRIDTDTLVVRNLETTGSVGSGKILIDNDLNSIQVKNDSSDVVVLLDDTAGPSEVISGLTTLMPGIIVSQGGNSMRIGRHGFRNNNIELKGSVISSAGDFTIRPSGNLILCEASTVLKVTDASGVSQTGGTGLSLIHI